MEESDVLKPFPRLNKFLGLFDIQAIRSNCGKLKFVNVSKLDQKWFIFNPSFRWFNRYNHLGFSLEFTNDLYHTFILTVAIPWIVRIDLDLSGKPHYWMTVVSNDGETVGYGFEIDLHATAFYWKFNLTKERPTPYGGWRKRLRLR